jgi:carbamoylphosphate synthase small subunit
MKMTFIDHYDSFSFNVLDWLKQSLGPGVQIARITHDDQIGLARLKKNMTPIIISPGPGSPKDYPETLSLLNEAFTKVPLLGICLGHQMLGTLAGGKIRKALDPWHGTTTEIKVETKNWFSRELPERFNAVVYNSLIVEFEQETPSDWQALGVDKQNQLMMLSHRDLPIASVQFHPESYASDTVETIARNFLQKITQ